MDTEHEDTTGEGRSDTPAGQGISRKKFIAGTAAAGAAIGLGGDRRRARARARRRRRRRRTRTTPNASSRRLVLMKGKIHTMDGSNRVVERDPDPGRP